MRTRAAAWGVDLTGGAVRAVHVERVGSRYRIVDVVEQPTSGTGEAAEPLSAHLNDAVGRALTDLRQSRGGTLGDALFVALPVFGAKHGRVEVPIADPARAAELLDFEVQQALGSDRESWLARMTPPKPAANGGFWCDWFAQRRELVQSFVADLRRFGLPFDGIVAGPLALARYTDGEWSSHGRRLFVECHRTRTDFLYVLADGGRRWRSLPFGCGGLADAPAQGAMREKEAARIALQLRTEQHDAHDALFGKHDGTPLDRIVLLGEGARHEELRRALERELDHEVVTPHAPRTFEVTARAAPRQPLHDGTALGLAMAALDADGEPLSLVAPPRARLPPPPPPTWTAALLLLAIGLLATHFLAVDAEARLRALQAQVDAQTQFGGVDEWDAAQKRAETAHAAIAKLEADLRVARRRLPFPRKLYESFLGSSGRFRLASCELVPGDPVDRASLVFDVDPALGGAVEVIRGHLRDKASITATEVETRKEPTGALHVDVTAELPWDGGTR